MGELEIIRPRRMTLRHRIADSVDWVRSLVLGPWNPKDPAIARYFGATPVASGISVNEQTAMTISAVWSAVTLISGHVGALPLKLYKRTPDGGKTVMEGHPLYRLLHDRPNNTMTAVTFRETGQASLLLYGNFYAEIVRDSSGRPTELWPLLPWSVTPFFQTPNAPLMYRVSNANGGQIEFAENDILHIRGLCEDGIVGLSVIQRARESLGLGLAAERFGATFFRNGLNAGGIISYPQGVNPSDQVKDETRTKLDRLHTGVENSHRFLALYQGAKFERLGIPPEDAQFLETRQFQIAEIARWFNLPPHKLKDLSRATFSNIEHQSIEYVTDSLWPWLRRWEAEISRKLIAPLEQSQQFAEFLLEGLLRGDAATRAQYYKTMSEIGAISVNEIRLRENLNPVPGGDLPRLPANTAPIGQE